MGERGSKVEIRITRGLEVNKRVQLGTRALGVLRERVAQVEIIRRVVERVEVVVRVSVVPSDGASELAVHDLRKGVDVAVVTLFVGACLVSLLLLRLLVWVLVLVQQLLL